MLGGAAFSRLYARRISERDETLLSMWMRVRDHLRVSGAFAAGSGDSLTTTARALSSGNRNARLKEIENILEEQIPALRRRASPSFNKPV